MQNCYDCQNNNCGGQSQPQDMYTKPDTAQSQEYTTQKVTNYKDPYKG